MNKKAKIIIPAIGIASIVGGAALCGSQNFNAAESVSKDGTITIGDATITFTATATGAFNDPISPTKDRITGLNIDTTGDTITLNMDRTLLSSSLTSDAELDSYVVAKSATDNINIEINAAFKNSDNKNIEYSVVNSEWTDDNTRKTTIMIIKDKTTHKQIKLQINDIKISNQCIWTDITGNQTTSPYTSRQTSVANDKSHTITSVFEYYNNRNLTDESLYTSYINPTDNALVHETTTPFSIELTDLGTYNSAPEFVSCGSINDQHFTTEENVITVSGQLTDEDNDTLTCAIQIDGGTSTPVEVKNNSFTANIDTKNLSVGTHTATITVSDGFGGEKNREIEFEVTNSPPTITYSLNNEINREGDDLPITAIITDLDIGQDIDILYSINDSEYTEIDSIVSNGTEQQISISLDKDLFTAYNKYIIKLKAVDDNNAESEEYSQTVTIKPIATPPEIDVTSNKSIAAQYTINKNECTIEGSVSDVNEEDTLTVSAKLDGTKIDSKNIVFDSKTNKFSISINTANLDIGEHKVLITASDGELSTENEDVVIQIENTPPEITINNIDDIILGSDESASVIVKDINIGQLIDIYYAIDGGEEVKAKTISNISGQQTTSIDIKSSELTVGNHSLSIRVSDGTDETSDTQNFTVVYQQTAPVIKIDPISDMKFNTNTKEIEAKGTATDINGDPLTLYIYFD